MTDFETLRAGINQQLDKLPSPLGVETGRLLTSLLEQWPASDLLQSNVRAALVRVFALSEFVATTCERQPTLLVDLLTSGALQRQYCDGEMQSMLNQLLIGAEDEGGLKRVLRQFRQRQMLRIAWRDLAGWADLAETMADLSALADACIQQALNTLQGWLQASLGTPLTADGRPQDLVVLGMGKLGGRELNFSSDVDLIFAYPEAGETQGGSRSVSNEEFFTRLGRQLIHSLDDVTEHGFVFRIDMRLRPFGESGPLAMSFDAMENYFQVHGREWERYAMIKARVVAGAAMDGEELMAMLRPFVYRRYLDFGALEAIRDMKQRIATEIKRKRLANNIKLGEGGIREIEFIGQAFQLIRGGSEKRLQQREILTVLHTLQQLDYLPAFAVTELCEAYVFLRNTEHRLQEYADKQTHLLPADDIARLRLAFAMGFADWDSFYAQLEHHMQRVHNHFSQVFEAPQAEHDEKETGLRQVWLGTVDDSHAIELLTHEGFNDAPQVLQQLQILHGGTSYRALSRTGRERMDNLMPLLLGAVAHGAQPELVLKRVLQLVEAIARRTSYLALLIENPMVLSQLVKLCRASPWISEQLTRQPILLDELLDPRSLYAPPGRQELEQDLRERLSQIDGDDLERQMDVLRHFKNANVLRVAAADIAEAVPLMVVSDHLTNIAEVVIGAAFDMAWHYVVRRHGRPQGLAQDCDTGFAVIAYGKLGGIELGYGSDLDLVFIYDADPNTMSGGERSIANAVFYSRLGQRMIHIFSAITPAGVLYEVDMRLRPSGASGLLVTHLQSFADYQHKQAWTWEHQALVRARAVAGDAQVIDSFNTLRQQVLGQVRDEGAVKAEVRSMRERMRRELDKSAKGQFDLKQGHGGIADIEFMVQYAVLAHASRYPDLMTYSDNIRILEAMAQHSLVSAEEGRQLADVYRAFRSRIHRLNLRQEPALVAEDSVAQQAALVRDCWQRVME
jgi:glutamate-ammonia-ligase adenylyltransferase